MSATSTATSPDTRGIWAAAKGPVLIGAIILVTGIALALLTSTTEGGALDPRSVTPEGSRALAKILERQGVSVEHTASPSSVDGVTLLVTRPDLVDPDRLQSLMDEAAAVVLVAPTEWAPFGVTPISTAEVKDRAPGCSLAARFGEATMGGVEYVGGESCYGSTLVRKGSVTVLGTGQPMTNKALADKGNAALMMNLLGQHEKLVWHVPTVADPGRQQSLVDLVPDGWKFGVAQLFVAVALLALWRARRLGPVVTEPLPVVVRSAETVEGRARMYRRARAVGHAAQTLRRAARDRVLPVLGLSVDAPPAAVADEVAARTPRSPDQVLALLYGPEPADERALVKLVDELDAMENEVCGG